MAQQSKTVILARVSSKAQEDEGYSLDSQLKLLEGYCLRNGLSVVRVFKIAETASKEQSRKIFHELLDYLKREKVYHLAVEKTDRLTRNFKDAVAIDDWLEKDDNRRLHAVKESLLLHKNAKSDVKFMWNIHLAVAKKYTDNLREEAMKGWAEKLAQGWLPAPPPPGYMTVTENGKRVHVPNPETKDLVAAMFKKYLEPSQSIRSITEEMRRMGLTSRFGRPYAKSAVQAMLENPFYIGINRFDGRDYPGAQQQFVSREVFGNVQYKMHRGQSPKAKRHNPVLKGLVKCAACGGMISWELQKGYYYGRCQKLTDSCKRTKYLRQDKVEEVIKQRLERLVCPSEVIVQWVADSIRRKRKGDIERREKLIASIQAQIGRLKHMDSELYDDKLAGEISRERYAEKHEDLNLQIKDMEGQLAKAMRSSGEQLEERLVVFELSQKASGIYDAKSPEQKRIIIKHLFSELLSTEDRVTVRYNKYAASIAQKVRLTQEVLGGGADTQKA